MYVCVCVFCLLTPVLFKELSLTASNQQIYDLYKIVEKKDIVENNILISINYLFNVIKLAAEST